MSKDSGQNNDPEDLRDVLLTDTILDEDQLRFVYSDTTSEFAFTPKKKRQAAVAAKLKYLTEYKKNECVSDDQILITSFRKEGIHDIRDIMCFWDLEDKQCDIRTLTDLAQGIVNKYGSRGKQGYAYNKDMYSVILKTLRDTILKDETIENELFTFFSEECGKKDEKGDLKLIFDSLSEKMNIGNLEQYKKDFHDFYLQYICKNSRNIKVYYTIRGEEVKSLGEQYIANYLFEHGIDYEYEAVYPYYFDDSKRPYYPDFTISYKGETKYIEFLGAYDENAEPSDSKVEDGKINSYKYTENAKCKQEFHNKVHKTDLLSIYPGDKDSQKDAEIFKAGLKKQLDSLLIDNVQVKCSDAEILSQYITDAQCLFLCRMGELILDFINIFKDKGLSYDDFDEMKSSTRNVRSQLFLTLCEKCYIENEQWLNEHESIGFSDTFKQAADILKERNQKFDLNYKYIILYDYQDLTEGAFDFVKVLADTSHAKLIAVGDGFSSVNVMNKIDVKAFRKYFQTQENAENESDKKGNAHISESILNIANAFLDKQQTTNINSQDPDQPMTIFTYDDSEDNIFPAVVQEALDKLVADEHLNGNEEILFLGRTALDHKKLYTDPGLFVSRDNNYDEIKSIKYPELHIHFQKVTESKENKSRFVFLLNGRSGEYGFPLRQERDPVFSFVKNRLIEERQLFYLAMTRATEHIYFFAPQKDPSEFLMELVQNNPDSIQIFEYSRLEDEEEFSLKDISQKRKWYKETEESLYQFYCPICGAQMLEKQVKTDALHLKKLYVCTENQRFCGFMTNNYELGSKYKLAIQKCGSCHNGYLIVDERPGKEGQLICTDYKDDGSGCGGTGNGKYMDGTVSLAVIVNTLIDEDRDELEGQYSEVRRKIFDWLNQNGLIAGNGSYMPTSKGEQEGLRWGVRETVAGDVKYRGLLFTENAQDLIKSHKEEILKTRDE